ncbi:MAG: glutamine synthetase family protein [Pseudomonadota bacterium]
MDIDANSLRTACADLGGIMRGARMPGDAAAKLEFSGLRMPLATLGLDLFGRASEPVSGATGDGQLRVTDRGPVPMPWLVQSAAIIPMWMFTEDGRPSPLCPRHALARVLSRWAKRNWKVTVAPALEFYLVDDTGPVMTPAHAQDTGRPLSAAQAGSLAQVDAFAPFFDALFAGAEAMGIALEDLQSGMGPAQFRLKFKPTQAMRAADDLWLAKALIRGTARAQGMAAAFVAKPFDDQPGSGMHLGFWAMASNKANVFDNGLQAGSDLLRQAVAGGVSCLPGAMLAFAPHASSYARYGSDSLAPTGASWGYENRTCALRIPAGDPAERRIEHRTAGSDANPYLALAAVLGGAVAGIEDDLSPPEPIIGSAYDRRVLQVPLDWDSAIERFSVSPRMARIFPPELIEALTAIKRQEQATVAHLSQAETQRALMEAA